MAERTKGEISVPLKHPFGLGCYQKVPLRSGWAFLHQSIKTIRIALQARLSTQVMLIRGRLISALILCQYKGTCSISMCSQSLNTSIIVQKSMLELERWLGS